MIVEATYAGGAGVLVGTGLRWVLLSDPSDESVLDEIWRALTQGRTGAASVTESVLAIVERAFDGEPPGLAMVDFTAGDATSIVRGSGHVGQSGQARILSLDGGTGSHRDAPARRLVGGVVGADRVEVRPVSPPRAAVPTVGAEATDPTPAAGLFIDGIPEAILAAKGPDGPPPRPRRRAPDRSSEPTDTGGLHDTSEPEPGLSLRIEEGGHTTIRPPVSAGQPVDHDVATAHRSAHLTTESVPHVLAVTCPLGHLSPASSPACRTCHQRVAPQEPQQVPRPVLGGLRLPTGEVVPLDRGVVLGRKPAPVEGSTDWPHLVHLPSDHAFVSRMHLHVELDGWDVIARDLGSRGGTTMQVPGRDPVRLRAGESYVLAAGTVLDLADVYAVRFETGPVVGR